MRKEQKVIDVNNVDTTVLDGVSIKYPAMDELHNCIKIDWSEIDWAKTEEKEDIVRDVILEMLSYHESTNQDKYEKADQGLYPRDLFMSDEHGKSINIFNAVKYLSRYLSEGFEKSNNRQDVKKAIHYLLFELARTK